MTLKKGILVLCFFMAIISCENNFGKDDIALIREKIEADLLVNMNNPSSYEFVNLQVIDTVLIRDIYLDEIENINSFININDTIRINARNTDRGIISRDLVQLRNVFRTYAMGNELELINETISLFNNNRNWMSKLSELETYIRSTPMQSHRYRNELPIFERLKSNAYQLESENSSADRYQSIINVLVEKRSTIQEYVDTNDEKMIEIAFIRTLFSFREQNVFGGIQLLRQIYEIRLIDNEIEFLWKSQKFDSSDFSMDQLEDFSLGDGINIIKDEIGVLQPL